MKNEMFASAGSEDIVSEEMFSEGSSEKPDQEQSLLSIKAIGTIDVPMRVSPTVEPKSLRELVAEIKREVAAHLECTSKGLLHAVRAGELLERVKEQIGHGLWLQWVRDNCDLSGRTAEAYMRLAKHWSQIQGIANSQQVANLTINGALNLIAKKKSKSSDGKASQVSQPRNPASGAASAPLATDSAGEPVPGEPAPTQHVECPRPGWDQAYVQEYLDGFTEMLQEVLGNPGDPEDWDNWYVGELLRDFTSLSSVIEAFLDLLKKFHVPDSCSGKAA